MTLDDIRARGWGFAVYAYEASDPVTLEVVADGNTFTWEGASVAACMAAAFPKPVVSQTPPVAARAEVRENLPEGSGGVAETTGGVFD